MAVATGGRSRPGGGQRQIARAPQDRAQAHRLVAALARAAAQRSLRHRLEARRPALAGRIQATRDRRQASSSEARAPRRRPRRGARRLDARSRPSACSRPMAARARSSRSTSAGRATAAASTFVQHRFHRRGRRGRSSRRCCATAAPTSCSPTWRRRPSGHTRTDHLRIMGLAEAAAAFACDVLAPGGVFLCQGASGRHRARAARSAEALYNRAARQAAGEPARKLRELYVWRRASAGCADAPR